MKRRKAANRSAPRRAWRPVAAALVVGFVAFWPLVHRGAVAWLDIHPWKLCGFAMYTTYSTTHVALFEPRAGGLALIDERTLPPLVQRELLAFRGERGALGALRSPDDLARRVFDARPDLRNLLVVVQRSWLDPATAHIASEKDLIPYERPSAGS
ncbi:MAG: hypothetical protein ACQGVK_11515 [Myxococcota bacterium]